MSSRALSREYRPFFSVSSRSPALENTEQGLLHLAHPHRGFPARRCASPAGPLPSPSVGRPRSSTAVFPRAPPSAAVATCSAGGDGRGRTGGEPAILERGLSPGGEGNGFAGGAHRHAGKPGPGTQGESPTLVFSSAGLLDDTLRKGLHSLRARGAIRGGAGEPQGDHLPDQADHRAQHAQGDRRPLHYIPSAGTGPDDHTGGRRSVLQQGRLEHEGLPHHLRPHPAGGSGYTVDAGHQAVGVPVAEERRGLFLHLQGPGL